METAERLVFWLEIDAPWTGQVLSSFRSILSSFAVIVALPGQRCLHRGTKPVQRRSKWDARKVASLSDQTERRGRVERAHSRHRRHI
jgi:hypothetical protein